MTHALQRLTFLAEIADAREVASSTVEGLSFQLPAMKGVLASSLVVERGAKAVGVKADVDARRADARRSFIV